MSDGRHRYVTEGEETRCAECGALPSLLVDEPCPGMTSRVESPRSMSPGAEAVLAWSHKIHGFDHERHRWARRVAELLDAGATEFPRFPSHMPGVALDRLATAQRIYERAMEDFSPEGRAR